MLIQDSRLALTVSVVNCIHTCSCGKIQNVPSREHHTFWFIFRKIRTLLYFSSKAKPSKRQENNPWKRLTCESWFTVMSLDTSEQRGRFTRRKTSAIESGEQVRLEKNQSKITKYISGWAWKLARPTFWSILLAFDLTGNFGSAGECPESHEYSPSEAGLQVLYCHFSRTSFCGSAFLFIVSSESHATYIPTSSAKNRLQGGVKGSLTRTGHSPGFCLESWW